MSISFGNERKKETAVEVSRRERQERTKKRLEEGSKEKIVRCYRRHVTLRGQMAKLRELYDATMDEILGGPEGLKILRLSPNKLPLPANRKLYCLVYQLLFFYNRKTPDTPDVPRLIDLSRLISASITRPTAGQNYAFLTCDTPRLQDWTMTTKRLIVTATSVLQSVVSRDTLSRVDFGVLSKLLMDLVDSKHWAYIRVQGKKPSEYTAEEQLIIKQLNSQAASLCTSLLSFLATETCMFSVTTLLLSNHIGANDTEDVLAAAAVRIAMSIGQTSPANQLLFTKCFSFVPSIAKRVPKALFITLVSSDSMWDALVEVVFAETQKSEAWPQRHLTGNLVEIGHSFLASQRLASRRDAWIGAVQHLLKLIPSWLHVKRLLEVEPLLEKQFRLLWAQSTVDMLFAKLLQENTPTDVAEMVQKQITQKEEKKQKGFFARLKDKAMGKEKEPEVFQHKGYSSLKLDSAIAAWKTPQWMSCAKLFNFLVVKWSSRVVLSALASRDFLLVALWKHLERHMVLLDAYIEGKTQLPPQVHDDLSNTLLLFLYCYDYFLPVCDDNEFYVLQRPFSIKKVCDIVQILARFAFRSTWQQAPMGPGVDKGHAALMNSLKTSCKSVLLILNDRNVRREFCEKDVWMVAGFRQRLGFHFDPKDPKTWTSGVKAVVHEMPFLICFADRAVYLRKLIEKDREENLMNEVKYGLTIRRDYLLEDGLTQVAKLVSGSGSRTRLKARFHVQFQNSQGLEEAGIDAGGVFKEFIEALSKKGFNPNLGLFKTTEDNKIYPNPESKRLYTIKEYKELYEFLGRIVAKAIYEGVVLNLPMAEFFLNTMLGRSNFVEDLKALDPSFHRNLLALKDIDDVEDLCLTFSFEEDKMGKTVSTNLIPNGADVVVTNDNLIQYIAMMAHVKLNLQFKEQASAFISGFHDVLPPKWINLFNRNELQQLISGSSGSFDVAELRHHTKYAGGYSDTHSVIKSFWRTLEEFSDEEKASFLSFVTSSSKPPLLGFSHLHPPFCIRTANEDQQSLFGRIDRLPSASTCFNLLKLPSYKSRKDLKEKLLYSINSGAGFELS